MASLIMSCRLVRSTAVIVLALLCSYLIFSFFLYLYFFLNVYTFKSYIIHSINQSITVKFIFKFNILLNILYAKNLKSITSPNLGKNLKSIQKMLQSSPAYLKCHQCKKSPKQFTFLLCNHIICSKCIPKKIEISHKYNLVKCSCGCITYFNEENQIIHENQRSLIKQKRQQQTDKSSNFRDQRTSVNKRNLPKSHETIGPYSKTLINQRSTMPMLEVSEVFSLQADDSQQENKNGCSSPPKQRYIKGSPKTNKLRTNLTGTENTKFQESQLLENYQNFEIRKREQINRQINQFSTHFIQEKEIKSPKINKKAVHLTPHTNQINFFQDRKINKPNHNESPAANSPTHIRFQNEIDFMKILFQKDVQEIQFQFKKVIQELKKAFLKLEEDLKSLYVQEVITKDSIFRLDFSQLVKDKYRESFGQKFKTLKNQLFLPFYNFKHNQNLISYQSPVDSPILYTSKQSSKPRTPTNNSVNQSQIIEESEIECEEKTMKNKKVQKFNTVEQRLYRLTTKQNEHKSKNQADHVKLFNQGSSKRIQTQNIHTSIKRSHESSLRQKQNYDRVNSSQRYLSPDLHYRLTEKPQRSTNMIDSQDESDRKRRQIIYFSPPVPYCYKHLQKRQKEAKNYVSYIQKLCHENKMKNNHELFKKVKQGNLMHDFRNRE